MASIAQASNQRQIALLIYYRYDRITDPAIERWETRALSKSQSRPEISSGAMRINTCEQRRSPVSRLFRPIDFVKLNRIREAFEVNLTITFEPERLACTKLGNYSRRQDLTWFGGCADSRREIDR
jgi:hypothetical protein